MGIAMGVLLPQLYLIIDTASSTAAPLDLRDRVSQIAAAGCRMFVWRDKHRSDAERLAMGQEIASALCGFRAQLYVHGRADLCQLLDATGIHLPQRGLPVFSCRQLIPHVPIGVSCHSAEELRAAERSGANFATISPVFRSKSSALSPMGLDGLRSLAATTQLPLYALGGCSPDTARACIEAGARGVAVMRGLMDAQDPYETTRAFLDALASI